MGRVVDTPYLVVGSGMAGLMLAIDFLLAVIFGLIAATSFASVVTRLYTNVRLDLQLPKSLVSEDDAGSERGHFPG